MKKIESLTEEQEAKMLEVKNFWLNYINSCKNSINKEAADLSIEWLYKLAGYGKPVIIYVDSPLGCQYATNLLKAVFSKIDLSGDQVRSQVESQVWSQVRSQVESQVRSQVESQVRSQVRSQVWSQVGSQVWSQVGSQVRSQVWSQVESQVRSQVWIEKLIYERFSTYGSITDYGWVSFIDFFQQIGIIDSKLFTQYKQLLQSGIYDMIQLNGFCIVSNLPIKLLRNNSGALHNPTGPAIEFKDGYQLHFINGRFIPAEIFHKSVSLTKEQFLSETNSDYKGAWYEILGQKKMMDLLGAVEVDTRTITHKNGELETITLFKTQEVFEEINYHPFAWVKMVCPSTGTQYLQGVEPHHSCALEAIASLSPFKKEEYSFDLRS